ncbi:aminomethyl-transferring glycine dehydrogenase subunit GcvPB [bacterium]|nr:aminomethyl-transferring glycine dehydrogenase subunit GcvPB [bacterium]
MKDNTNSIFDKSRPGRTGYTLPHLNIQPQDGLIPERFLRRTQPNLPEVSEGTVVRHFVNLSTKNHHVDKGFYPLGSCTMKYNPKVNNKIAQLPGFAELHPFQPSATAQGALRLMRELGRAFCEITGMDAITLQPAAGAHGEFTALLMMRAYHAHNGSPRKKVIIPDSAHGTNPASIIMAGYEVEQIKSNSKGLLDLDALKAAVNEDTAALMLTNPNTLGIFESGIEKIADIIHDADALLYMDGANLNALMGIARPGDMGFDAVHLNLHKTFSTPHGGGGPGSGPVAVNDKLEPFLPYPVIDVKDEGYIFDYERPLSIGRVGSFYGNFAVMVRAYTYILMMGSEGLTRASLAAIVNANYLKNKLREYFDLPYSENILHEVVFSGSRQAKKGVKTREIAKRLLDYGFHAPTVYFPLIVPEALMIEPTETETMETLDAFAQALIDIDKEIDENPEMVKSAPHTTPVRQLDEAAASRKLKLKYTKE